MKVEGEGLKIFLQVYTVKGKSDLYKKRINFI